VGRGGAVAELGGLVVVHAHPDDETLATGALLATWAGAGLPVTVVTATRGERGEVIPPGLRHLEGDGPALAAHRAAELSLALTVLGVTDHVFLDTLPLPAFPDPLPLPTFPDPLPPLASPSAAPSSSQRPRKVTPGPHFPRTLRGSSGEGARYEDSGMVWVGGARAGAVPPEDLPAGAFVGVPLDEAAGRLAGLLRARRPAVVATYDPEGGYGHPDHVRVHEVTMRAVALAAGDGWEPVLWWRRTGRAALSAARRALAGERVRVALAGVSGEPEPRSGWPDEPAPLLEAADEPASRSWVSGEPPRPGGIPDEPSSDRGVAGGRGRDGRAVPGPGGLALPDPGDPFPAVAVPDDEIGLAVDTRPVRDRVLAALRAHATQVQAVCAIDGDPALVGCYALSDGLLAPLLPDEGYVQVAGPVPALPAGVRRLP
jgi:N-acetyl-1-D-myo-inositol-2-amino-2-deoxy-alpha-D-glucopyranoside deacetylase